MQDLIEYIGKNSVNNTQEIEDSILGMVCEEGSPIALSHEKLLSALKLEGEFLVLNLHYSDYNDELENELIKYKISQALSVIVSYEDDGSAYEKIEQFVKYITANVDAKQNAIFGVKKVDKLSPTPVRILFSGILPINQLKMTVGSAIDKLIHSDDKFFLPHFYTHRDAISKEIGIPLLPILPRLDENLGAYTVQLVDLLDGRLITEFEAQSDVNKESIDIYLEKLFYVYKVLAQEKATLSH